VVEPQPDGGVVERRRVARDGRPQLARLGHLVGRVDRLRVRARGRDLLAQAPLALGRIGDLRVVAERRDDTRSPKRSRRSPAVASLSSIASCSSPAATTSSSKPRLWSSIATSSGWRMNGAKSDSRRWPAWSAAA
jgi:hypothetical protein